MTVLQELTALYDERAEREKWPRQGFSTEKIGGVIVLRPDGSVAAIRSMMQPDAKNKLQPRSMNVPADIERAFGIAPNQFWDKTAYTLGVIRKPEGPGQDKRTREEHEAFLAHHLELLKDAENPDLIALRAFCESRISDRSVQIPHLDDGLLDKNLIFRVGEGKYLHDLPEVQELLQVGRSDSSKGEAMCLVSGGIYPVKQSHPKIKDVMGAQLAGARIVSFNGGAYESHGHKKGSNAPVSEAAAFAYGTALNKLLAKGSGRSLRIADATVAFWAKGDAATASEQALAQALGVSDDGIAKDEAEEQILSEELRAVAEGKALQGSKLKKDTQVFVLGLSPNAGRLSVRFWYTERLQDFACRVTRFWEECAIKPSPFKRDGHEVPPRPTALLKDMAAQHKAENIPSRLGGDLMRAILTGGLYPATLLTAVLGRLRVEGEPDRKKHGNLDGRRGAVIRAILTRNYQWKVCMSLDENATEEAYLLGRLFAAYVYAERSYQDRNAGLRQKYMGAVSATPARVFPMLMRGYEHNLDALRKAGGQKAGSGVRADRAVAAVMAALPGGGDLPASLPLEEQGRFFIGFYHQISAFYAKAEDDAEPSSTGTEESE